jgi:phosphatidate cytidylyltransferase
MDRGNLVKRVFVALLALPFLIYAIVVGHYWFEILIAGIILLANEELFHFFSAKGVSPNTLFIRVTVVIVLLAAFYCPDHFKVVFSAVILSLLISELFNNRPNAFNNIAAAIFILVYPLLLLLAAVWIRRMESAGDLPRLFVLIMFISIWASDTFAYFGGVTLGKHKIFLRVSPKKTWEGFISGLLGTVLVWVISAYFGWIELELERAVILGTVISVSGVLGDFFESLLKRDAGIKDSSEILPGHGGILDRFDSLIFVAPAVWILVSFWH